MASTTTTVNKVTEVELRSLLIIGGLGNLATHIIREAISSNHFTNGISVIIRDYKDEDLKPKQKQNLEYLTNHNIKIHRLSITDNWEYTTSILKGHDVVISFHSTMNKDLDSTQKLIECCELAGVQRFIPNVFGVDYNVNTAPWLTPRTKIKQMLESSKLNYTEFVIGYFLDEPNLRYPGIFGISFQTRIAKYTGSNMNAQVSFTYRSDVAKFVVYSLCNEDIRNSTRNKVLRVEGDRKNVNEIIEIYEKVSGVVFDKIVVDADELQKMNENLVKDYYANCFVLMAANGTAVVNPKGEGVDNGLFERVFEKEGVKLKDMWDHARERWEVAKKMDLERMEKGTGEDGGDGESARY
ncbi:hypothetical protein HDU76_005184 [Blyttiomyces sp. JEL0837]|nr:hypothetical protein HDU76_005184 [Blyttiomyces sp. JEL0837]